MDRGYGSHGSHQLFVANYILHAPFLRVRRGIVGQADVVANNAPGSDHILRTGGLQQSLVFALSDGADGEAVAEYYLQGHS